MPIRAIDSNLPIEPVPEVDREPGAVEHKAKRNGLAPVTRARREMADSWCGHDGRESLSEEEDGTNEDEENPRAQIDYKA